MVTFVPTPIGNLEDITFRTVKALQCAEVFFCEDTRVVKRLLSLLVQKFSITLQGDREFYSLNSHNEKEKLESFDSSLFEKNCVFLSDAGTPCISDPGSILAEFCRNNDIKTDSLPGANALLPAFSLSGFEESIFTFLGFLHNRGKERQKDIKNLMESPYPVILYESPKRVESLISDMVKIDGNRTVFLAKELTKLHQKTYKDSCENLQKILKNDNLKGEWTVIVAPKEKSEEELGKKIDEIKKSDLKIKDKAKLLSEITDLPPKEWYRKLLQEG